MARTTLKDTSEMKRRLLVAARSDGGWADVSEWPVAVIVRLMQLGQAKFASSSVEGRNIRLTRRGEKEADKIIAE